MQHNVDPYQQQNKRQNLALWIGLGVLVLLLVAGFGLNALGVLGPKQNSVTQLQSEQPQSMLPLNSGPTEPVMQVVPQGEPAMPVAKPPEVRMPDDIYAWLEHLRKTDEYRKKIAGEQLGSVMATFASLQSNRINDMVGSILGDEDDSGESVKQKQVDSIARDSELIRKEWQELRDYFLSYPAPAECVPIQTSYSQSLGETSTMILEILDAITVASSGDPDQAIAALSGLQGQSGQRIDALSQQADRQVQDICDKYKTRKWFSIFEDVGGGIMGKIGGLGF